MIDPKTGIHEPTVTLVQGIDYREWPDQSVSGELTTAQGEVHHPKDILWLNAVINYSMFKEHLSRDADNE